jgi:acyl-CoA synthetase (AMP-forming)/AMP-acid ligase II
MGCLVREFGINRTHLTDYLRRNAEENGGKAAIIFGNQTVSWQELWQRVAKASGVVSARLDSGRQEVVAILAPNSPEFVIAYLAVVHAGHIALPLDISFKKLEISSVIGEARPRLILASGQLAELFDDEVMPIEDLLAAKPASTAPELRLAPAEQIATLFLSSGTTGRPKIIPNTHANILWDLEAISKPMGWTAKDSLLITLHLSHRHGLVICFLGALYHHNTIYLEERFNARRAMEILESGKVSLYSAVPSIYESLVGFEPGTKFDLGAVRHQ